jgi:hypothetical protein
VHGVIFSSLRDYVAAAHGPQAMERLFEGEPAYVHSESYPDERLTALVGRAADLAGVGTDEVLHDFGVFAAQMTFARLYPAFFSIAGSARDFLLTVETRIHELVRATIPNAAPPRLTVSLLGEDGVEIHYDSPRRLCVLLRGLTEGTARHYGETASLEERTCMLRGDDACRFEVRLAPGSSP